MGTASRDLIPASVPHRIQPPNARSIHDNFFIHGPVRTAPMSQYGGKTVVIDLIMENTGVDPVADSKRIISAQIGDSTGQEVYYTEAPDGPHSLFGLALRVNTLVARNHFFAGYDIKRLERPFLSKFLALAIPEVNVLDLRDIEGVASLRQSTARSFELDELCRAYGISMEHRRGISEKAETIKKRPEIRAKAASLAPQLAAKEGRTLEQSLQQALDRIATGQAVVEAYDEFVQSGGSHESAFYKYATGNVVCENSLLQALSK